MSEIPAIDRAMPLIDALQVLHKIRGDQVVISTMSPAREWMNLGTHPLDFIYAPSSMGQAPTFGLGMAIAQPQRQVIVLNGDGCMLMNLGALVTITAEAAQNFVLIVFDNGVYEVTGMQATAGAPAGRQTPSAVDYCAVARGCGFTFVFEYADLETWQAAAKSVLAAAGPTFVLLRVQPMAGALVPKSPGPAPARAQAFKVALSGSPKESA